MAILVFQTLNTKAEQTLLLEGLEKTCFGELLSDALDVGRLPGDRGDTNVALVAGEGADICAAPFKTFGAHVSRGRSL